MTRPMMKVISKSPNSVSASESTSPPRLRARLRSRAPRCDGASALGGVSAGGRPCPPPLAVSVWLTRYPFVT